MNAAFVFILTGLLFVRSLFFYQPDQGQVEQGTRLRLGAFFLSCVPILLALLLLVTPGLDILELSVVLSLVAGTQLLVFLRLLPSASTARSHTGAIFRAFFLILCILDVVAMFYFLIARMHLAWDL